VVLFAEGWELSGPVLSWLHCKQYDGSSQHAAKKNVAVEGVAIISYLIKVQNYPAKICKYHQLTAAAILMALAVPTNPIMV
jgi:hypothetical protein